MPAKITAKRLDNPVSLRFIGDKQDIDDLYKHLSEESDQPFAIKAPITHRYEYQICLTDTKNGVQGIKDAITSDSWIAKYYEIQWQDESTEDTSKTK